MSYFDEERPVKRKRPTCASITCLFLADEDSPYCSVHKNLPKDPPTRKRAQRRANDAYYTFDPRYTLGLVAENRSIQWPLRPLGYMRTYTALEPCVGDGGISRVLSGIQSPMGHVPFKQVWTSDLVAGLGHFSGDASKRETWDQFPEVDWIVTNPPYSAKLLIPIIENALTCGKARAGVAMFLRLSYLEPCHNRAHLHTDFPPDQTIVMPRLSFTQDGGKDQVTCAWFIWDFAGKKLARPNAVTIVTHNRLDTYMKHPEFSYSDVSLPVSA